MSSFYTDRYNRMVVNDRGKKAEEVVKIKIWPNMAKYLAVQKATGVPKDLTIFLGVRMALKTKLKNQ